MNKILIGSNKNLLIKLNLNIEIVKVSIILSKVFSKMVWLFILSLFDSFFKNEYSQNDKKCKKTS